ncbi:MAG: 4-(cytidine 5'-diphospho)-2-C-methyl-D-erythritol kinase [Colwellia sp.]
MINLKKTINKNIDKTFLFPAPAKLNLFLHVVGQRNDGYHELETLFQFINYSDTLSITVTETPNIDLLTPIEGVENKNNLIVKAASLLQQQFIKQNNSKQILGAKISLKKILPMGGGLGGGSSNAATVLVALNTLWQYNFSTQQIAELGLLLGADVPIFIHGFAAFAQGVGEQFTLAQPDECWYLISKPNISISTASVFTSPDLPRNTAKIIPQDLAKTYGDSFKNTLFNDEKYHNDCQTMVIKHYDKVAKLLAWLVEYAPSRMTGTGACVFSRFGSQQAANELQAKLPYGISSFVAKGLNKSPLVTVMENLDK